MRFLRSRAFHVISLTSVLACGAAVASAQGASPWQGLLTLLEHLQSSVNAVQDSVNTVQESVNALSTTDNFLFTPIVRIENGIIDCNVVNVVDAPRQVQVVLINAATASTLISSTFTVLPGRSASAGAFSPGAFSGAGFCKVTVLDGIKSDVRANLTLTPNTGGDETTSVSVAAE